MGHFNHVGSCNPLPRPVGNRRRRKLPGALKSLLRDEYDKFCVETLEQAFVMGRQKSHDYKIYLKEWRPGVTMAPEDPST